MRKIASMAACHVAGGRIVLDQHAKTSPKDDEQAQATQTPEEKSDEEQIDDFKSVNPSRRERKYCSDAADSL